MHAWWRLLSWWLLLGGLCWSSSRSRSYDSNQYMSCEIGRGWRNEPKAARIAEISGVADIVSARGNRLADKGEVGWRWCVTERD
jgi:hypothetical protein